MSGITSDQLFSDYFQEFRNIPKDWEGAQNFLTWYLTQMTNYMNAKEIGIHASYVIPCGKQLYLNNRSFDAQRLTIAFGALPAAGTKSVAHGIDTTLGFRILNLYLAANDTTHNKYFCLQYYSIAPGDIVLNMDATNVNVTVASNYSAYNDCFIILEFIQGSGVP